MKILYPYPMKLSNGYSYMLSILQFLNALADFIDIQIYSLDSSKEIEDYFKNTLGLEKNQNLKIQTIKNKFLFVKSNKFIFFHNLKQEILKLEIDDYIIYSRDFKQMKLCLRSFKKMSNIKFVFEAHQIFSNNLEARGDIANSRKMRKLEEYVFNNTDYLISITSTLKDEILRQFSPSSNLDLILPVGFNADFLQTTNNKKDIDIIYVGNFSKWKGLDILIKAVQIIKFKYKINLKVVLIGARKKDLEEYKNICREFNVFDEIDIMERSMHKKILEYLQRSKIGALPVKCLDDGNLFTSPLKLYEYLGVGLKVVAAALPSIKSNISDDLVYFFEPEDAEDMAKKIIFALNDQSFNILKVKNFARNYTWNSRAKKFLRFVNENISSQV